jgi:hypothetical protein
MMLDPKHLRDLKDYGDAEPRPLEVLVFGIAAGVLITILFWTAGVLGS